MGNSQSIQKINYEDIQYIIKNPNGGILINVLSVSEQDCLIPNTIGINKEAELINECIRTHRKNIKIVVYGKNCCEDKIYEKYTQLTSLGFFNTYIYVGGMFEWLMLQDIYGKTEFPTTKNELDILKYKPKQVLNVQLIGY
jgi:uncharacterized membrane protein